MEGLREGSKVGTLLSKGWCWEAQAAALSSDASYFSCRAGAEELSFGWEVRVSGERSEENEDLKWPR